MTARTRWLIIAAALAAAIAVGVAAGFFAFDGSDDEPAVVAEATATAASSPTTAPSQPTPPTPAATPTPSPSPTAEPSPSATPTTRPASTLSSGAVLNAEYLIADMNATVRFEDGAYYWVREPGQSERENPAPLEPQENWKSTLDPGLIAFGDLDGDGDEDAAVIIRSQFGGTGVFVTLAAVRNDGGSPAHVASAGLGDRVAVNSAAIDAGQIVLDMLTHAPTNSPQWAGQCCPNVPTEQRYRLEGVELVSVQ